MTFDFNRELVQAIPEVERYARRLTRNAAKADDLVQDCLERALRNRDKFEPGTNLEAWLCTILKNLHYTKWSRERRFATVELTEEAVVTAPSQEHRVLLREVGEAIGDLSPDHHEMIHVVAISGDSYQDAADALGMSVGTIRSRLSRARAQLRANCEGRRPAMAHRHHRPAARPAATISASKAAPSPTPKPVPAAARRFLPAAPPYQPAMPRRDALGTASQPVCWPGNDARHPGPTSSRVPGTTPTAGVPLSFAATSPPGDRRVPSRLPQPASMAAQGPSESGKHRTEPPFWAAAHALFRGASRHLPLLRNRSPPGPEVGTIRRTLLSTCVGLTVLLVAQALTGM